MQYPDGFIRNNVKQLNLTGDEKMSDFSRLHRLLERFTVDGPPGCACMVSRKGETLFTDYVGFKDMETKRPIAEDTIYRIYSMSKVITCTAAMMLYERGAFLLSDPLSDYLPEYKHMQVHKQSPNGELKLEPAENPIHIRDLFTMTSGFTYCDQQTETDKSIENVLISLNEKGGCTARELAKAFSGVPLAFEPGTHWRYGMSHDILGGLIETVSGKTLGEFFHDEIFIPLDMKDTSFSLPENKKDRLCSLYGTSEKGALTKLEKPAKNYQFGEFFESGGAGLYSTLGDYAKFAQMLACGGEIRGIRLLGKNTVRLMAENHLNNQQLKDFNWPFQAGYGYGLGVRVMINLTAGGSNSPVGEFGWAGLAGTWVMMEPEESLSAVYMQQMIPNMEENHALRLRSVIFGLV
jgi:CubicO group peptidase (beta-lactamase class C family)